MGYDCPYTDQKVIMGETNLKGKVAKFIERSPKKFAHGYTS